MSHPPRANAAVELTQPHILYIYQIIAFESSDAQSAVSPVRMNASRRKEHVRAEAAVPYTENSLEAIPLAVWWYFLFRRRTLPIFRKRGRNIQACIRTVRARSHDFYDVDVEITEGPLGEVTLRLSRNTAALPPFAADSVKCGWRMSHR